MTVRAAESAVAPSVQLRVNLMLVIGCPEVVERFGLTRTSLLFVLLRNYVEIRAVSVYARCRRLTVGPTR